MREVEAEPREEAWEAERNATRLPEQYADQWDKYGVPLWRPISRCVHPDHAGVLRTDFSLYRSLVYVVDVAGEEPPTFYNLTDLRRHACYTVREIPIECRFGADLWFHETQASVLARAAFCSADFMMTSADTPKPPPRKGYFQPRWPLRGADRAGYEAFAMLRRPLP